MFKFYITTPIYYPNAKPHIGSAYTTLVADSLARLYRSLGYKVFFLTGIDEHGEKIYKIAKKHGQKPKEYVDKIVEIYKHIWKRMDITYDRFIRTSDKDHEKKVKEILELVYKKGDIYKSKYEGYYCVDCESYYTEKDLIDGKCPYHLKKLEKRTVDSYFFKLSKYKQKLLELYEINREFLPPNYRENIIQRVKELKDISISRPKSQLQWGIELPFDKSHVTYVWFDALINYISGIQQTNMDFWPPDVQLMGKDIIWFHTTLWPAMLMSIGLDLPKREIAHGFLTVDNKKMSKSLGNIVDPETVIDTWGSDALRYYLLFKVPFGNDGDFSWKIFKEMYAKELIGNIGNLANRIVVLSNKILKNVEPFNVDDTLAIKFEFVKTTLRNFAKINNTEGIITNGFWKAISFFTDLNTYLNENEIWKTKDKNAMLNALEGLFVSSSLLGPILPSAANNIAHAFGLKKPVDINMLKPFGQNVKQLPNVKRLILYKKVEENG